MTRTEIVMQAMTPDELDALIRDAEAERERRKVKPCVRRMEDSTYSSTGLAIDNHELADVWHSPCKQLNIDHATAKRQIALAFCWADWGARANLYGLSHIEPGTSIHCEFCWLVREIVNAEERDECTEAARAAGWIK